MNEHISKSLILMYPVGVIFILLYIASSLFFLLISSESILIESWYPGIWKLKFEKLPRKLKFPSKGITVACNCSVRLVLLSIGSFRLLVCIFLVIYRSAYTLEQKNIDETYETKASVDAFYWLSIRNNRVKI